MLCDCFTGTERPGNSRNTALCNREECINYTLTCNQGHIGGFFCFIRTLTANGPFLHHGYVHIIALFICDDRYRFFHSEITNKDFLDYTFQTIGNHDLTCYHCCFLYDTDHIAGFYCFAGLFCGFKFPFFLSVQRMYFNASVDVCTACFIQFFQRTLDTVIDRRNQAGAQLYAHRHTNGNNFLTGAKAGSFFINLNGSSVSVHFNDFTNQMLFGYTNHVKHVGVSHTLSNDQWTRYFYDGACCHIFIHLQSFIIH